MSTIDVRHAHALPDAQARAAIEQVAAKLSERFGLKSSWAADVLNFSGSGVDGAIELQPAPCASPPSWASCCRR